MVRLCLQVYLNRLRQGKFLNRKGKNDTKVLIQEMRNTGPDGACSTRSCIDALKAFVYTGRKCVGRWGIRGTSAVIISATTSKSTKNVSSLIVFCIVKCRPAGVSVRKTPVTTTVSEGSV